MAHNLRCCVSIFTNCQNLWITSDVGRKYQSAKWAFSGRKGSKLQRFHYVFVRSHHPFKRLMYIIIYLTFNLSLLELNCIVGLFFVEYIEMLILLGWIYGVLVTFIVKCLHYETSSMSMLSYVLSAVFPMNVNIKPVN